MSRSITTTKTPSVSECAPEKATNFHPAQVLLDNEMQLFIEILDLKARISELEERLNICREMATDVLHELIENGKIKSCLPLCGFEFDRRTRRTYLYTSETQELEKTVKEIKKREEQNGTAIIKTETVYLNVCPIKEPVATLARNANDNVF